MQLMAADYLITRYMIYAFSIRTARPTDEIKTETNLTLASNINQRSQNEMHTPFVTLTRT